MKPTEKQMIDFLLKKSCITLKEAEKAFVKIPKPKLIENPDWSALVKEAVFAIDYADKEGFESKYAECSIYRAAMTALFGEKYFEWQNMRCE